MPGKASLAQRDFILKRLQIALQRIEKATNDEDTDININDLKADATALLQQLEEMTMYLVDHPTDDATTSNIIENFTYIEDQLNKSLYSHRKTLQQLARPYLQQYQPHQLQL